MNPHAHVLDYAAVGIGPANMSLAALAHPVEGLRGAHLERRESFSWHPGLLLPEATLQVSLLKDLVTLVDPSSPFSFLAFLASEGRLYRFLAADFPAVLRAEFNQYLQWVAARLPSLTFGAEVHGVDFHDGAFHLRTGETEVTARHLVLGTGLTPSVPEPFRPFLGPTVFHSGEFLLRAPEVTGRRVVVVGGGQSGAEIVRHLAAGAAPESITWVSRRSSFLPMDDSPFANDLYTPDYVRRFHALPAGHKARLLDRQKYTSDGIDLQVLQDIYRLSYRDEFIENNPGRLRFMADCAVTAIDGGPDEWKLTVESSGPDASDLLAADIVILSTGYAYALPDFMAPLDARLHREDGMLVVGDDFSVAWDGPAENRIYLQNGARHSWGVADPNLSLLAWRSAVILNSMLGETRYQV
ncbi:lysine N(6)-hydroxylase/L-ornithine N(5)-oxygenase family protein [Streptomyces lavendulae]|uniref:lysine N(6)-hydroxylase/L-ornithine N(5)-oxygenase family protein n=1 Tax=Streptomyces lavendulae TaxID=1914 RepID=UPI0024A4CB1C|nr:SidA/IucD/PvdA family monooxygenase [Streptomyces lavendulae]GLX17375.1 L-lysine 6-monooxygenase [Streptomyces lavendulae subsp. lavendulae]GLX24766.1 L-lysine 6-monooxygenase [Streptomyces lavendulae subsp. lavendulae]